MVTTYILGMTEEKKPVLSLSWRGRLVEVCSAVNGAVSKTFDWANALADAAIIAGATFFTSYAGSVTIGVPALDAVKAAAVAAGSQFFLFLALKRGLVKDAGKA